VTAHSPRPSLLTQISDLNLAYPFVQPLPGDRVLVVGARSAWRPVAADRNAVIYDAEGRAVAEDVLGDGIEHVLTTTAGDIWVGYSDEGVFGNYGWGSPGPRPVGSCGLIRFSSALQPAWRFPPEGVTSISDCYALNVTDDEVWTCYYAGFPVVRVRDGLLTAWENEVQGPRALAVAGTRVALYGGYGDEQRLAVGVLDGDRFVVTRTYRLEFPGGSEIPPRTAVFGRGAELPDQ
jgi:hypothetical protein